MSIIARSQITLTTVEDGDGYSLSIKGGVRGIAYAADGSNPDPKTSSPFSVEVLKNGVPITPFSYSWFCGGNLSGSSTEPTFTPLIKSAYVSGNSFVTVMVQLEENAQPYSETVPIVSTKFADGLDWIMDWNSTATVIKDNKVITPKIFAGKNEGSGSTPLITGVAMGLDVLGEVDKTVGLIGYYKNDPRFKLDVNGNFFVGSNWGGISIGKGGGLKYDADKELLTISGNINILGGAIKNKDVDEVLKEISTSVSTIEDWGVRGAGGEKIVSINGGAIKADSITADKLMIKGLTVKDNNDIATLMITQEGDVLLDGTLRSNNFSKLNKTGYQISRDGNAILNQAEVRGKVQLPNAGITDEDEGDKAVRFWAGGSYENRNYAPFKVYQDGSIEALSGIFNGSITGDYDNYKVHIRKDTFYIDEEEAFFDLPSLSIVRRGERKDSARHIQFSPTQSIINTDLYFGRNEDRDFEYLQSQKQITTKTKNISRTKLGSIVMNYIYENNQKSDYHILNSSGGNGGSHDIRYEKNTGGLIFESSGSSTGERPFDYKFKKPTGDVVVSIEGSIDLKKGITSPKNNIEMRATSDGFAFYAI